MRSHKAQAGDAAAVDMRVTVIAIAADPLAASLDPAPTTAAYENGRATNGIEPG
jgi:hypothetical protein